MKKMLNNMWRSVTALVLVLTMVLGTCGTAFAAKNETVDLPSAESIVSGIEGVVEDIYNNEALKEAVAGILANEDLKAALENIYTSEELANVLAAHPELEAYAGMAYAFVTDENVVENTVALARAYGVDEQVITEALAALEAAKTYNEGGRADIIKNLDGILVCLEENVIPELQRLAAEMQTKIETEVLPELEAKLEQLEKDFADATEAAKDAISAEIAKVEAEIENVKAVLADVQAKVDAAIEAVENAIDAIVALNDALENLAEVVANGDFAALNDAVEDVQAALNEVAAAITVTEDAVADINAAIDGAQEFVGEVVDTVVAINTAVEEAINTVKETVIAINTAVEETIDAVKKAIADAIALAEEIYNAATTAEYAPTEDSLYVALGDESAAGAGKEYAALLAEELGVAYKNLAVVDGTIADVYATLATDAATIAEADLITLGFSANAMLDKAIVDATETGFTGDWAALVGDKAAALVAEKLAELTAELAATAGDDIAAIVATLVESLAYNYVEFVLGYPALIAAIREVNTDAVVIVVGMYNPLEGVVVEGIEIGEYVGFLTELTNLYLKGHAIATLNAVYVDAPEVATDAVPAEYTMGEFAFAMMLPEFVDAMFANEEGHEYIKDQILGAIEIVEPEEPFLLGDANMDGKVNIYDAITVLKHYAKLDVEVIDLRAAEVDGNNTINIYDAINILKYYAKLIPQFPVEA